LIKETGPDQLLAEWFTKSLLPLISRDVSKGGVVIEEEVIARAQYLDLFYSQSSTLYEFIPNAPRTSINPSKPSSSAHSDGVIGSVKTQSSSQLPSTINSQLTGTINHSINTSVIVQTPLSSNSTPTQVYEVNAVQSISPQQSEGENKTKNKPKKNNNQTEN